MHGMAYYRFFLTHPRQLSLGVLLTLFSSFGQTFLIAIFVPQLLAAFALDTAQFGMLYAGATLTSAVSLPFFGRLLDRVDLRRFSLAVGVGLVVACWLMALASNVPLLFLAILGLRLTGQGLLSLTASTTMARVFAQGRGKALSVSALGYPLGEGLLPLLVVLLVHAAGWRLSWGILGGFIALVLLPAMHSLVADSAGPGSSEPVTQTSGPTNARPLRDWRFYALLPANLLLPLISTALFLYQVPLAETRGWSVQLMASAFIGFAVARLVASLAIGPVIDRWGAQRLFPVGLIPLALGLACLTADASPWTAFAYLALTGVSQGLAGPLLTALWAELYGVETLGATKGTVATFGVLATALGPLLLGGALRVGIGFDWMVPAFAALTVLAVVCNLMVRRQLLAEPRGRIVPATVEVTDV